MSTRTIIELNHDFIHELQGRDAFMWDRLLQDCASCGLDPQERMFMASRGLRILGQRHHSEPEWEQRKPAPAASET